MTFIGGVLISLFTSFLITSFFYKDEMIYTDQVEETTDYLIELLQIVDVNETPRLLDLLEDIPVDFYFLEQDDNFHSAEWPNDWITNEIILELADKDGEEPIIFEISDEPSVRVIGTEVLLDDQLRHLFIVIDFANEISVIQRVTINALLFVLIVGSIFIVLVSRYFVSSIEDLTKAAEQLSTGDFSIRLFTRKKDEIGKLTRSFNQLASELANMEKMREDFVSNVSHEIQSPLTSIKGYTKALMDDLIPQHQQKEYLAVIYQESDRLSRLGDNLLKMASLDSDHHPYRPDKYRLDEQLRRTVLATEPLWNEKDIEMELELADQFIVADQDLLEQVWLNLITNAIKYTNNQGKIRIVLQRTSVHVEVSITDNGMGIPKEAIPYIFDRFYKVDKARSHEAKGNGLGLSIVKKILLLHHATIDVESYVGEGSTFSVKLPLVNSD